MQRRRRLPRYKVALSVTGYDLYLVSGASGHCLEFTSDLDSATGIVIAERWPMSDKTKADAGSASWACARAAGIFPTT
jgi:hypothetical protein